jgi:hypothetical protein
MNSATVTGPATGPVAENRPPASPRVGMLPPFDLLERGPEAAAAFLAQAADDVAEFLAPYADAGCVEFNLVPQSPDPDQAIAGLAAVKKLLAQA